MTVLPEGAARHFGLDSRLNARHMVAFNQSLTLMMGFWYDAYLPLTHSQALHGKFAGAEFIEIVAGGLLHFEDPIDLATPWKSFLLAQYPSLLAPKFLRRENRERGKHHCRTETRFLMRPPRTSTTYFRLHSSDTASFPCSKQSHITPFVSVCNRESRRRHVDQARDRNRRAAARGESHNLSLPHRSLQRFPVYRLASPRSYKICICHTQSQND